MFLAKNMKFVIYLLLGIAVAYTILPEVSLEKVKSSETAPIATTEVKAEEVVKEPVKDVKKTETKKAPEKPVDVVKDNPKGCDRATEWIYPDGSCHAKASPETKPNEAPTASTGGSCDLVYKYSNWDQNVAYAVCMAESSGNPNNENWSDTHYNADGSVRCRGSFGLMQLACFWIPNPKDPVANMAKSNEIYSRSGWSPWGAYTSGKYLKYLR